MPPQRIDPEYFSKDALDFIGLLHRYGVRYVIVGGEAVIFYGHARLTGDIDFFYERSPANVQVLFRALLEFWSGDIPGIATAEEFLEDGIIVQFGRPPHRIDLLSAVDGLTFQEAWDTRRTVGVGTQGGELPIHYVGLEMLIQNKLASGRPKDVEDVVFLRGGKEPPTT